MNNDTSFLIGVIVVAFIAGYAIVSFFASKIKSCEQASNSDGPRMGQSEQEQEGSQETTGRNTHTDARDQENEHNQYAWQDRSGHYSGTRERQDLEEKYARILGLRGEVTPADAKRAYRELLTKYHPDKVNHLGAEFKTIAEIKTREILEAYDYFQKKYNII